MAATDRDVQRSVAGPWGYWLKRADPRGLVTFVCGPGWDWTWQQAVDAWRVDLTTAFRPGGGIARISEPMRLTDPRPEWARDAA